MLTTLLELHYDVTLRDIEGNNAMAAARCPEQARPQGSLTHQETHQETHLIHWAIVGIQWIQWMSRVSFLAFSKWDIQRHPTASNGIQGTEISPTKSPGWQWFFKGQAAWTLHGHGKA